MKIKVAVVAITALTTAISLALLAEAGLDRRSIEASGILKEEKVAVNVPAELAILGMDISKQGKAASGRLPARRPAGAVATLNAGPGKLVEPGDILVSIDPVFAGENAKKAQAQYDYLLATVQNLKEKREELADKREELKDAEAELKSKRAEAERQFTAKHAEGQAKLAQMEGELASVKSGLKQAEDGLRAVQEAEAQAKKAFEDAKDLPDSDTTKAMRIEKANAALQGVLQKKAMLAETLKKLSAAGAQLGQGVARAKQGLELGKQSFNEGLKKMNEAMSKIADGRKKVDEGISELSRKIPVLEKRQDQAGAAFKLAQKIFSAATVEAGASGRVRDVRVAESSVVYPGQRIMSIAREDKLKLDVFVPLKDVGRVSRGNSAKVFVDSDPGRAFAGKVVAVGGRAVFAPSNMATKELELARVIRVTIEVVNEDGILKAGMPADVKIN